MRFCQISPSAIRIVFTIRNSLLGCCVFFKMSIIFLKCSSVLRIEITISISSNFACLSFSSSIVSSIRSSNVLLSKSIPSFQIFIGANWLFYYNFKIVFTIVSYNINGAFVYFTITADAENVKFGNVTFFRAAVS